MITEKLNSAKIELADFVMNNLIEYPENEYHEHFYLLDLDNWLNDEYSNKTQFTNLIDKIKGF